ncbi:MAG: DUF2062 domain-containing protein [Chromatiaceae bacterium]|nr:DUF2062 domain-containing protein [Gammaproteobacteria bacterium]MCB1872432.1 DUF2062 domain-containing protein [Gammaproteobacteria bacterium]MCB1879775.1 DUF2062 domain-containing protein [Gammaproteobacteria bacterium]MCP5445646.1 DUF2062 domain-containing protein [Chromatiaceae bacterium]
MPKQIIKRFAPDHEVIRNHKHLRIFGNLLHDPNLWHMNRRSVSGAFAVGLFWAFIPIPMQMVAAAAIAIIARVNLPISVALVWITNPLTMPPIFYFTYLVGAAVLDTPASTESFKLSFEYLSHSMAAIWQPLFLGSLICALLAAGIGYCVMRGLWRLHIVRHLKRRRNGTRASPPPPL